jgi:hypothetical protein
MGNIPFPVSKLIYLLLFLMFTVFIDLQSLIRNKHLLENAVKSYSKPLEELVDHALTENEWVGVAQIECILKKMTTLNMDMQSDIPGK